MKGVPDSIVKRVTGLIARGTKLSYKNVPDYCNGVPDPILRGFKTQLHKGSRIKCKGFQTQV